LQRDRGGQPKAPQSEQDIVSFKFVAKSTSSVAQRLISQNRGKMLAMLMEAHGAGQLTFFNTHAGLTDKRTFKRFIAPLRHIKWVVYCKAPFAGPKQVLRYLSRYTHRVAISNRRLIVADDAGVAFRWKDYRADGPARWKTMRLHPHEFIRRFLLHVLPKGFHRIRHYGLLAQRQPAADGVGAL
jgi:putative transposase